MDVAKLFSFSETQPFNGYNEDDSSLYLLGLLGILNELIFVRYLELFLTYITIILKILVF